MDERLRIISKIVDKLNAQMFADHAEITEVMSHDGIRRKKVPYGHREELLGDTYGWDAFDVGSAWGDPDGHELFRFSLAVPERFKGKEVFFFLSTGAEDIWNTDNPQMLVYINGKRRCGMDMNHNCISIYTREDWDNASCRDVDIAIYAYSNLAKDGNLLNMKVAALDETAKDLYFDMMVPLDGAKAMLGLDTRKNAIDLLSDRKALETVEAVDEEDAKIILEALSKACELLEHDSLGLFTAESMEKARDFLKGHLYGAENGVTVASVGHTHIDVAWKWQVRQTREKVIRSFSTVMELMKRYPEYLFMFSTPQMFEFVREDEPELFEEVMEKVREGRFEPEGAMWLEADCNLTSGESLVRQILYGKEYFRDVFGVDSHILWLPDVFGYSAAMPQILKKSGVKVFITTKLGWNDTNRMPHDLFMWRGIDGSEIPTYLITTCNLPKADQAMKKGGTLEYTYNGRQDATQIMGTWRAFREKEITREVLTCYGFGDGGGGPTWEMLEMDRRLKMGIPGCPRTEQKTVSAFMEGVLDKIKDNPTVPVWDDELYLEFHRGTYTSIGKNKRNNRKLEVLLGEAELLGVFAKVYMGEEYPAEELDRVWKILMLHQFHDILPGSSIEAVYQDSDAEYKKAFDIIEKLMDTGTRTVIKDDFFDGFKKDFCIKKSKGDQKGNTVLGFDRSSADEKRDEDSYVDESISVVETNGLTIVETYAYKISFDKNAEIISLYDKEARREVADTDKHPLNRLIAFRDEPKEYDAWNIDADFEDVSYDITDLEYMEIEKNNREGLDIADAVTVHIARSFRNSKIYQDVIISNDSRRIDFVTKADWHEHQILLKAAFPVNIDSKDITCEIQYGSIKRRLTRENSWDKAKFECCAHRWMDISEEAEDGYGVAILNDCKYGYDAKEKLMRLTLIKSGIFPNPNADQGMHEFTYSLFPHMGDYRKGKVIEEAQKLNTESLGYLGCCNIDAHQLLRTVIDLDGNEGVYIGAVKLSQDKKAVIIRLYEGHGRQREVKARLLAPYKGALKAVTECNLLEQELNSELKISPMDREVSFLLSPYEIKTIRVEL